MLCENPWHGSRGDEDLYNKIRSGALRPESSTHSAYQAVGTAVSASCSFRVGCVLAFSFILTKE